MRKKYLRKPEEDWWNNMNQEKTLIQFLIIGLLFCSFCAACSDTKETSEPKEKPQAVPQIKFEQTEADLGTLQRGEIAEYAFYFTNTGDGMLIIKDVVTDCGCTAAETKQTEYAPGEEGVIRIRLNTGLLRNNQYKTTTVITNAKDSVSSLSLSAFVESEYELISTN